MSKTIVLMFHEIHDRVWFEEMLRYLRRSYRFINLDELCDRLSAKRTTDRVAHVTFDDGHRSFFENAYPIMKKLNVASTLFVSPIIVERK